MLIMEKRPEPNDKQALLDATGYEIYNRELVRKVFPRIIREAHEHSKGRTAAFRDVIAFYFLLQSYIDGTYWREDGSISDRFGACFLSYEFIMSYMHINRTRLRMLARVLEANGIIRTVSHYEGTKRFVWYFPSFCPRITDDGYIVNEFGEKIQPEFDDYFPAKNPLVSK
jgi:hypothetical protein